VSTKIDADLLIGKSVPLQIRANQISTPPDMTDMETF